MLGGTKVFSIDEGFRQLRSSAVEDRPPARPEFRDPLLVNLEGVALSRVIDEELDRFYNPGGPVELLTRVFRRFRKAE